ncbi:putative colanic acid biosynthesis acetyltransferase [Roseiconus nitratireducens]|uniref:Putative colanic acid biosynthesis acetyltransferase n=1 Tax=Roseiconus nitratireducens TaxID=2605748 RepID=A0A5M6DC09_9BACT|nr:putative colanic acid biosynthesis acetyltransferase [Roseiconus nitratireducens]
MRTSRRECPSPHSTLNKVARVLWGVCWWTLFRPSPRICFRWRALLLRLFGAKVTSKSRVDPTVRIWAPWNLTIGSDSSIGHHVDVYNVAPILIGDRCTVSQYSYLCSASHDIADPTMRLTAAPIRLDASAWICARAFVGPGVHVATGSVVGACGVAVKDVSAWTVVAGNPARFIREREIQA